MAFCPSCGAAVEGRYCAKCGTAVDAAAPAPIVTAPAASASGLSENAAATLCYVLGLITGIIFLVLEPYSKNKLIRFHAFQSIFLHVGVIIIWIAIRMVLPWQMLYLAALINLAFFALWIYLLVQTYQGKKIVLPVIGELASKQA